MHEFACCQIQWQTMVHMSDYCPLYWISEQQHTNQQKKEVFHRTVPSPNRSVRARVLEFMHSQAVLKLIEHSVAQTDNCYALLLLSFHILMFSAE